MRSRLLLRFMAGMSSMRPSRVYASHIINCNAFPVSFGACKLFRSYSTFAGSSRTARMGGRTSPGHPPPRLTRVLVRRNRRRAARTTATATPTSNILSPLRIFFPGNFRTTLRKVPTWCVVSMAEKEEEGVCSSGAVSSSQAIPEEETAVVDPSPVNQQRFCFESDILALKNNPE